jgi:uncharacterized membrane protein (DUF2068 family)
MKPSERHLLRLIALFKLFKATLLIAAGVGALKLQHQDAAGVIGHWVMKLGLDPGNRYIDSALARVADLSPAKIRSLGVGSFIYAGLFLTEGIGLWLTKRWAEWFTAIITGSLVPVELYEIYRHPGPMKVLILVINIAVVGYLVHRIRNQRAEGS